MNIRLIIQLMFLEMQESSRTNTIVTTLKVTVEKRRCRILNPRLKVHKSRLWARVGHKWDRRTLKDHLQFWVNLASTLPMTSIWTTKTSYQRHMLTRIMLKMQLTNWVVCASQWSKLKRHWMQRPLRRVKISMLPTSI